MLDLNLNYMLKVVNLEVKSALNERSESNEVHYMKKKRNKNNKGEANDFITLC